MDRRGFLLAGAAFTLAGARTARRPVVLATADLEARLVAVDLGAGEVLAHVPTMAYPMGIETVGKCRRTDR